MKQDATTYYVWIGGSCDYGHKERAGAAAVVVEHDGSIIKKDVIADLHTTEFRMMLTLMLKMMDELPEGSDIVFLSNAAYIQNFDKIPTAKTANPDLLEICLEKKKRHKSVGVKIVPYHKSPLLIETHDMSTEAMKELREEYNNRLKRVIRMEQLHDIIRAAIDANDKAKLTELENSIKELEAYYEGEDWRSDYDADERGFFPKDLKRGILAEDTLYDLFADIDIEKDA